MKKSLLMSICFVILSVSVLPDLVLAKDKEEKVDKGPLTKKVFIHYRKPHGKPENPGKPPKPPKDDEGSYTYIANGMKWKTDEPENYLFNPGTLGDYSASISEAMTTWDEQVSYLIFGSVSPDPEATVKDYVDDENVIVFGNLSSPEFLWLKISNPSDVIAVTLVWGYYNAPPRFREIIEVDMVFNTGGGWTWGNVVSESDDYMDVLNIATHEIGHAAGMGDLYDTTASEETMYGYSTEGETKKRSLESGDIAGITNLYK